MTPIPLRLSYDESTQDATFFIDNSGIEVFDTCSRAAEYKLNYKRELNREKPALKFGGIIHKLLEHRYRHLSKSTAELVPELITMAQAEFEKWTPPDGDYRNFAMAVDFLQQYALDYPFESFDIIELNGAPAIETPFAIPLASLEINGEVTFYDDVSVVTKKVRFLHLVIKGKMDLITSREGRLIPIDHKTTSMMGPTYFADFMISSQVYTYSWAVKQLTGRTPDGFTINGLGIRAPTKTGKKLEFRRFTVPISKFLLAEWEHDMTHKVADYIEMCRRGYLPKQTKWCAGKYGMCEYHGVCTLDPDMRTLALGSNEFKDVTWDPTSTNE